MDSIVILGLLLAATIFSIAGFITKLRVLNLFSAIMFLALIPELADSAALVIFLVSAFLIQAVYIFLGLLGDRE